MELTYSQTRPSMVLSKEEQQECIKLLKKSILLRECDESQLRDLARKMEKRAYKKGDVLVKEGTPQSRMFVVAEGEALREKTINGQVHHIDTNLGGVTIGSLHVLNKDPAYATTKCMTDVVAYEMSSDDLKSMFVSNPDFASNITKSLTSEVRRYTRNFSTPLVLEHPKRTPILAVSVAASIESFYRAALNSVLNQQLTGQKSTTLFPNMHIQIPTRVVYINGFKGIRQYLDSNFRPENYSNPTAMGLLFAVTPGVCMTPISSILEASNAGHSNPEPLYTRWSRGLLPRGAREVIFGVGLNQLSDYCEERVPYFENQTLRNAVGSMSAGVISGYLSHVVHNMSTLKLLNPNKTYWQHFQEYSAKAEARLPQSWSPDTRRVTSYFTSCIFPKGYLVRTAQIVGSFMILNGTINAMQKWMNGNSNNGNGNQK